MKFLTSILLFIAVSLNAQLKMFDTSLSQRIANYNIDCFFDPENKLIKANEILKWKNLSDFYVATIQLHLYLNALKNGNSSLQKNNPRLKKELMNKWGYCKITGIFLEDGTDIKKYLRYIHPDDANLQDSSVVEIDLPYPIEPQGEIVLKIYFEIKIPFLIERCGYYRDFYHISQWFPKVGVFEGGRWICHQYHRYGEFYSDFGVYDVSITAPKNYIIGACGILLEETEIKNGLKRYRFYCEDIHDFAWSADKNFIEVNDKFENVNIRILHQPGHEKIVPRFIDAIKTTLDYFGKSYGKYPYPQVTCIDSPVYAAVMEYPTLFVTGNFDFNGNNPDPEIVSEEDKFPLLLTIHEFGHNWWMGIVANNETEEMWLDESINSYATTKAMEYRYGNEFLLSGDTLKLTVREFEGEPFWNRPYGVILKPAWAFNNSSEFVNMTYFKGELLLLTLENYFGEELWHKVMKTYFQKWRFKHPKTKNFFDVVYDILGHDMEPFITQYMNTTHVLDFYIGNVSQKKAIIKKDGCLCFPVKIELILEDGIKIFKNWDANENSLTIVTENPIKKIFLDPDKIIEFELNKNNNIWIKEKNKQ